MKQSILITQCLQNDFVEPIQKYDPIPNLLHVGYSESRRLMGENPSEGAVIAFMEWALKQPKDSFEILHIRDWHNSEDLNQKEHLAQFGLHCIENTHGANFVYQALIDSDKNVNHNIVNASGLNDFYKTNLQEILKPYEDTSQAIRVGLIGVWTEAKISFLAYELSTRYAHFEIGICSALCASSSRHMHFISLDHLKSILGVQIFPSIGGFSEFLSGASFQLLPGGTKHRDHLKMNFNKSIELADVDRDILYYLYRDCKSVDLYCLDGGFSGNVVLRAKSIDNLGHSQVPTVIKIGARDLIAKERSSFERIEEVLGNNAPRIVDFAEISERGGIKYRYASMIDGKTEVFQDRYEGGEELTKINAILDVVFKNQLGRLYDAKGMEKLNLLDYYDFQSKYAKSVRSRVEGLLNVKLYENETFPSRYLFPKTEMESDKSSLELYNVCLFYERDLLELNEISSNSHFLSYVHGDLNGKNMILDAQNNVWLIDFFHTHRGHVLKDLLKLENDLLYIFTKIKEEDWNEACQLTDILIQQPDLGIPLKPDYVSNFTSEKIKRAYLTACKLRSFYPSLIDLDRDPYQMHVGLLRYAMHTLSFDECSHLQKLWALRTGCILSKKIQQNLVLSQRLRVDYIPLNNVKGKLGLTILPGRKDRGRNLQKDLQNLKEENVTKIISLITEHEYLEYGVSNLKQDYINAGFSFISYPMVDQGIPDVTTLPSILQTMDKELEQGGNVVLHCVGGLGRSGTIAAAYLNYKFGMDPNQAISIVREHRSQRAVESKEQLAFLQENSFVLS
jgi:protein-tyrosine phosphatase/nicotinamidase-related amidase